MPSATIARGRRDVLSGAGPQTSTSTSAAERGRLVDRPPVVVDARRALGRRGGREHPAAAHARDPAARRRAPAAPPALDARSASLSRQNPIAGNARARAALDRLAQAPALGRGLFKLKRVEV